MTDNVNVMRGVTLKTLTKIVVSGGSSDRETRPGERRKITETFSI